MAQKRTWTDDQLITLKRIYPQDVSPAEVKTAVNQAHGPFKTWRQITGKAGYLGLKRGTYDRWHGPAEVRDRTSATAHHRKMLATYGVPCTQCGDWLLHASADAGNGRCRACQEGTV